MISALATCALLLLALTGCVVASMFLEERAQRRRSRQRSSTGPDRAESDPAEPDPAEPDLVGEDGRWDITDSAPETTVVIAGRDAADTAVAVLLGAYVASGGEAARRAAAWVTASAPSSLAGPSFEPGADLRGRTVAVRRLLELDEDGRCWLTLRRGIDIERGLERHPVTCPTLGGALTMWAATRAAVSALAYEDVDRVVATIDELEPIWSPTTGGDVFEPIATQLRAARDAGGSARIHVRLTAPGAIDVTGSAAFAREAHETV